MKLSGLQSELQGIREQEKHIKRVVDHAAAGLGTVTRSLVSRADSSSSSKSTCKPGDDSPQCTTPADVQSSQNIAIVLGVVIPLACAVIVLIFLHRRHLKKQRMEDINDPHKSLDFGMAGLAPTISKNSKKSKRKGPEMTLKEVGAASSTRKVQGLSMDLDMHLDSPYVLPGALNGSRESLHSMSRSMMDPHDPYRPVALMRPSMDNDSVRSNRMHDNGSVYSMSTVGKHSNLRDNVSLIANARPMSQSFPNKRADSMSPQEPHTPVEFPPRQMHSSMNRSNGPQSRRASLDKPMPEINEKETLPSLPAMPEPVAKALPMPPPPSSTRSSSNSGAMTNSTGASPARKDSMSSAPVDSRPESSNYGDDEYGAPKGPTISVMEPYEINPSMIQEKYGDDSYGAPKGPTISVMEPYDIDPSMIQERYSLDGPPAPLPERGPSLKPAGVAAQNRLSVMGMRPLPPDMPDETPELRANRIRSFYKEYFEDNKPTPGFAPHAGPTPEDVYDDYLDGVVFDPTTGGFYTPGARPFAQGPARRAMTPPPRGAMGRPRISGGSQGTGNPGYPHRRKFSAAYSTMSGGRPRGRSMPKKKLPPPSPLTSLPTPHKLKEDAHIFNPLDFAPPTSIRDLQAGRRPDSPLGTPRPYSPSVRAFTPLASSFDNLAALPSPHDLRKSGTYTALDFAPPSKIRDPNLSPSDAGSIRSARSGISAMQDNAVRAGAYRVSRIPTDVVTTRDDLASQLKPKMDMTSYA